MLILLNTVPRKIFLAIKIDFVMEKEIRFSRKLPEKS